MTINYQWKSLFFMNIVFSLTFENRITTRELVDFVGEKKRGWGLQMFGWYGL